MNDFPVSELRMVKVITCVRGSTAHEHLHMVHRDDVDTVVKGAIAFYHERGQSLWEIMVGCVIPNQINTYWWASKDSKSARIITEWWERVWAHPELVVQEKAEGD